MNILTPIILTDPDYTVLSDAELESWRKFLSSTPINRRMVFQLKAATADRYVLSDYESMVVSRFYNDGKLFVTLSDGYVVGVDDYIEAMKHERQRRIQEEISAVDLDELDGSDFER